MPIILNGVPVVRWAVNNDGTSLFSSSNTYSKTSPESSYETTCSNTHSTKKVYIIIGGARNGLALSNNRRREKFMLINIPQSV